MKKSRRRNPSSLASVLSIASVLVMLGLFLIVLLLGSKMENKLRENVSLLAMFHLDTDEKQILDVITDLEKREDIKEVVYYSSEDGLKEMTDDLNQDILNTLDFNPIPAAIEVYLKADYANQTNLARLKLELMQNKIFREVSFQSGILEQIEKNAQKVLVGIGSLALLFALIAITLINGTIRLNLYAQRFLIRSMQLVGATTWFITRPYIGRAMRMALWALLLVFPLLGGIAYFVLIFVPEIGELISKEELFIIAGIIILSGILLTMISGYFATRKYLRLKLEELY